MQELLSETLTTGCRCCIQPFCICLQESSVSKPFCILSSAGIVCVASSKAHLHQQFVSVPNSRTFCVQALLHLVCRDCLCPAILTRGADQMPVSTKFDMRDDPNVVRNYGRMLVELASVIPDGIVAFFVSYSYMDTIVSKWDQMGVLQVTAHQDAC